MNNLKVFVMPFRVFNASCVHMHHVTYVYALGLFAGFNKDSAQQFFAEDANRAKCSYDLNRLCLPQESADICLIKHTGQPYFGMYTYMYVCMYMYRLYVCTCIHVYMYVCTCM